MNINRMKNYGIVIPQNTNTTMRMNYSQLQKHDAE